MILAFEIIGTIAFALSGAMEAIKNKMDLFGVFVLGVVTAVGGGCIRDIILDLTPPTLFIKPIYVMIASLTSIILFFVVKLSENRDVLENQKIVWLVRLMDSLGLATFTVLGINAAVSAGYSDNAFFLIFLGTITGVGGGIMRDIMATEIPVIFRKNIYGVAAIVGAMVTVNLLPKMGSWALMVGAVIIVVIRMLAAYYKWNLPKID